MSFLNWMAEHWLLTIVLALILSGAIRDFAAGVIRAMKSR